LDEEKATLKNKAKRFKVNSAAFLSKTISCLRKVKSIDDKTEKSLNYINRLIEKTGDFISKEKKSISFVLSMVFAMNNTAANGVENPNNYIFDEIVRPTLEDGLIPSVLDYSSEIEFLDVLPPDMNSEQTIELSSLYYSEKLGCSVFQYHDMNGKRQIMRQRKKQTFPSGRSSKTWFMPLWTTNNVPMKQK